MLILAVDTSMADLVSGAPTSATCSEYNCIVMHFFVEFIPRCIGKCLLDGYNVSYVLPRDDEALEHPRRELCYTAVLIF